MQAFYKKKVAMRYTLCNIAQSKVRPYGDTSLRKEVIAMSVFNRQAKRLNGVAEVLHKGFLEALEVQVNRMAGKRRGVMYMRVQSLAHGIAQVEYFSKGKVDDTVLYYDTRLHAPDGEANLSERIVGAWHLPQWGEADLSQFELLATQARVQTLNDPVRFYEPGELKPMEFTIKKAA